jgi:predicted phage terminase large subunit-like protein
MSLQLSPSEAAQELLRRRAVRRSLTEWARFNGYEPAAHHQLLINELEAVARRETETLLVFMPPGSAKSTYVNLLFPSWWMANNPTEPVLTASHSITMAERWGRKTRNLIERHSRALGISVSQDKSAAGDWALTSGGEYKAAGAGMGIAGIRAGLGIIDDPFGSREDAESKAVRESRWNWYLDDFSSRLKPGAPEVIMHTRWHDDDLAGRRIRQLQALGIPHKVLVIKAEAEADDPLGREPGELLWDDPEGYNYGAVLRREKQKVAPRSWASLYQQDPVPDEGAYFKAEWFRAGKPPPVAQMRVYGGSDYAVTADGGDFTVHAVVGVDPDGRLWLLDVWRKRSASDEWVEAWCDLVLKWKPIGWADETGQIKSGVGPFLDKRARERGAYVFREHFPTRGDKAVRAQSIRGRISMDGLWMAADAPWASDLIAECLRFPAGVHDDQVDALGLVGQLLDKMVSGSRPAKTEKPRVKDWFEEPDEPDVPDWRVA